MLFLLFLFPFFVFVWWSLWSRFYNCYPFYRWWYESRIHSIIIVLICLFISILIFFFSSNYILHSHSNTCRFSVCIQLWFPFRSFSFFSILIYFVCYVFLPVLVRLEPNCNLFHSFFSLLLYYSVKDKTMKLWPVSVYYLNCIFRLCMGYFLLLYFLLLFFVVLNKIIHYNQFWYVHSNSFQLHKFPIFVCQSLCICV